MRRALSAVTVALAMISMLSTSVSALANAQGGAVAAPVQASTAASGTLPSGTVLSGELSKGLDAKKSKANDKVEAKTASDILLHGQIVVPRNTKIIGHVTEVKAHSKSSPGSTIKITFDRMLMKGGREVPLPLTIQAIARPLQVSFGSGPDSLSDISTNPGRMQNAGPQSPAGAAASQTMSPRYPDDLAPGPSPNPGIPSPLTSSPLDAASRGVVGIRDLSLGTSGPVSVLSSSAGNVHLDSGTQLALRVQ